MFKMILKRGKSFVTVMKDNLEDIYDDNDSGLDKVLWGCWGKEEKIIKAVRIGIYI